MVNQAAMRCEVYRFPEKAGVLAQIEAADVLERPLCGRGTNCRERGRRNGICPWLDKVTSTHEE